MPPIAARHDPENGRADRADELRAEHPLRRRRVHAGSDEPGAVVATLQARDVPLKPATDRSGEVAGADTQAWPFVGNRRQAAREPVRADLLDRLGATRRENRTDDHRHRDGEEGETDDER